MDVVRRRFPEKLKATDLFLSQLPYELVYTPKHPNLGLFEIRDEKDYPVMYSAVTEMLSSLLQEIRTLLIWDSKDQR